MEKFNELLEKYVKNSRMKQVSIASDAGISYNYLRLLLLGERHPSEQVVDTLARALKLEDQLIAKLLVSAGYAPSVAMVRHIEAPSVVIDASALDAKTAWHADHLAQQYYNLAKEVPESVQTAFFEEMRHLADYARYKYLLCEGIQLTELRLSPSQSKGANDHPETALSLNLIASIVGELYSQEEETTFKASHSSTQSASFISEMLSSIDQLVSSILAGDESTISCQPRLVTQIREVLRTGAPWEIRRRIIEAVPGICAFDIDSAHYILEYLRNDRDDKYGVDIRRRVIESLVAFFDADPTSPTSCKTILGLLHPRVGDDIYVALATMEVCGDILSRMKQSSSQGTQGRSSERTIQAILPQEQAEIGKIQRQLLIDWQDSDRVVLQYSLALYELLCAPDAATLSIKEGVTSQERFIQLVAVRYIERLLPLRPLEALQLYQDVLQYASSRNVRRNVVRALPSILRCLQETSIVTRTLARSVIHTLASDSDIHIRRAVADYAMRLFFIDREFLLTILRQLHQDRDTAIRDRLQPLALRLSQLWLTWYAETAGLVRTTRRKASSTPFGE